MDSKNKQLPGLLNQNSRRTSIDNFYFYITLTKQTINILLGKIRSSCVI